MHLLSTFNCFAKQPSVVSLKKKFWGKNIARTVLVERNEFIKTIALFEKQEIKSKESQRIKLIEFI